jgi:hypothetical protein
VVFDDAIVWVPGIVAALKVASLESEAHARQPARGE